jgi:hypothetical protein
MLRLLLAAVFLGAALLPALAGDDILDAIDAARKAYETGELSKAKQSLDSASQLVGQKNAERFAALLPEPLPGWTAEKPESASVGIAIFGSSSASRRYANGQGEHVEVRITGDSALVTQFAKLLINPAVGGVFGKIIDVGTQRALQTAEGTINIVIADKFLVTIEGSAGAEAKRAYAKVVDVERLSKM